MTAAMKLKDALWRKSYDQPRQHIIKQGRGGPKMVGGIGQGDHFLPHKFIKRSFEW